MIKTFKSVMDIGGRETSSNRLDIGGVDVVYLVQSGNQLVDLTHSRKEAQSSFDKVKSGVLLAREGGAIRQLAVKDKPVHTLYRLDQRARLVK